MNVPVKKGAPKSRFAPRDVRRKQLIRSAIASISQHGFSDTTLKHVTDRANLSVGIVSYHFDSKEALFDATLNYLADEHYGLWTGYAEAAGPDPARQLEAIIRADFDPEICTHQKLSVWFAFWGQAKYRPNYLEIYLPYDGERYRRIRDLCAALYRDAAGDGPDPDQVARTIVAQVDGAWLSMMLFPTEVHRLEALEDCLSLLALFFPDHFPGPRDGQPDR